MNLFPTHEVHNYRKDIELPETYSVREARDSLSTIFMYSDMKTYGGADMG